MDKKLNKKTDYLHDHMVNYDKIFENWCKENKHTPPRGKRGHFVTVGITMPPELRYKIRILSTQKGMDFSELIREACIEYLTKNDM